MYKLRLGYGDVNEWDKQEGEGEYISTKSIDLTINLETLSKQSIVKALKENFYVDLMEDHLFFGNGTTGMFSVIEDGNGTQNDDIEKGYIVDYTFTIERVNPLIDLEEVFEGMA